MSLDAFLVEALADVTATYFTLEELMILKWVIADSVLLEKMRKYDVDAMMAPQDPLTPLKVYTPDEEDAIAAAVILGHIPRGLGDHLNEVIMFPKRLARLIIKPILGELTPEQIHAWVEVHGEEPDQSNFSKRIIKASIKQHYAPDILGRVTARFNNISTIASLVRAGINVKHLMIQLVKRPIIMEVWERLLPELSPEQVKDGLQGILQSDNFDLRLKLVTMVLDDPVMLQPPYIEQVFIGLLDRHGEFLHTLISKPEFDPTQIVTYLLNSKLSDNWGRAIKFLFVLPSVKRVVTPEDWTRLIQHAGNEKKRNLSRVFRELAGMPPLPSPVRQARRRV